MISTLASLPNSLRLRWFHNALIGWVAWDQWYADLPQGMAAIEIYDASEPMQDKYPDDDERVMDLVPFVVKHPFECQTKMQNQLLDLLRTYNLTLENWLAEIDDDDDDDDDDLMDKHFEAVAETLKHVEKMLLINDRLFDCEPST